MGATRLVPEASPRPAWDSAIERRARGTGQRPVQPIWILLGVAFLERGFPRRPSSPAGRRCRGLPCPTARTVAASLSLAELDVEGLDREVRNAGSRVTRLERSRSATCKDDECGDRPEQSAKHTKLQAVIRIERGQINTRAQIATKLFRLCCARAFIACVPNRCARRVACMAPAAILLRPGGSGLGGS